MDELVSNLLPGLGAFGPCAVLGWWLINKMNKQIEALQARNDALTDKVITLGTSTAQVLAELRAGLKGGG